MKHLDIIKNLICGIEAWAADNDSNIHFNCWSAYLSAKIFLEASEEYDCWNAYIENIPGRNTNHAPNKNYNM